MPGKEAQLDEKSQAKIQQYEDKYASLNADITELEDKLEKLQNEKDQDAESYQHSSSESEQLVNAYQALLAVAKPFVEEDYAQAIVQMQMPPLWLHSSWPSLRPVLPSVDRSGIPSDVHR